MSTFTKYIKILIADSIMKTKFLLSIILQFNCYYIPIRKHYYIFVSIKQSYLISFMAFCFIIAVFSELMQLTNFSSVLISTPLKVNSIHYLPAFYTAHAMQVYVDSLESPLRPVHDGMYSFPGITDERLLSFTTHCYPNTISSQAISRIRNFSFLCGLLSFRKH